MKVYDDDGTELNPCNHCEGGRWAVECCSGAGGCDCRGQEVDMGQCNVCGGTGWKRPDADMRANLRTIEGRCFTEHGAGVNVDSIRTFQLSLGSAAAQTYEFKETEVSDG